MAIGFQRQRIDSPTRSSVQAIDLAFVFTTNDTAATLTILGVMANFAFRDRSGSSSDRHPC